MRSLAGVAALVLGVGAVAAGVGAMGEPLAGSEWGPVRFGTVEASAEVEQFVRFEAEGRVVGQAGCNRFTGSYTLTGDALTIGPLAATRMACPPPRMALETALFAALDATRAFRRERTELTLLDGEGHVVADFRQRDWD